MGYMIDEVNLVLPIYKYSFPQVITKQVCKDYKKNHPQTNTSNVKAWHSDYNTHETTDVFDPLIDITLNKCYDISREDYHTDITNECKFVIHSLWLTMYKQKDYTLTHHHFPFQFAACYYVDVKDDSSPITFGINNRTSIQPKNGMLLIWSGMIPHRVMPTKGKRTCICMNIGMDKIV